MRYFARATAPATQYKSTMFAPTMSKFGNLLKENKIKGTFQFAVENSAPTARKSIRSHSSISICCLLLQPEILSSRSFFDSSFLSISCSSFAYNTGLLC